MNYYKKNLINLAIVLLIVGCKTGRKSFDKEQSKRPNILVIQSDQHSGKVMTQTGYKYISTPGIDKLAEEGITFTRSYTSYPVCMPFGASVMTGRMPHKSNNDPTSYPSIGKKIKDAGYETARYGKWHVSHTDMDKDKKWHGFEQYADLRNDTKIEKLADQFIQESHDKPFSLWVSFLNPHDCCELARNISGIDDNYHDGAVAEHMDVSKTPPLPSNFAIPPNEPEGFYVRRTPDSTNTRMYRKHPVKYWGAKEWRQYMYGYDRLVEKLDHHIQNIIQNLKDHGLLKNTVIFYTSDHGDGHASHQWNQKMNFYEEVVNIPFIMSWKGHTKADKIDSTTLVSNGLDLYPTILSLAGITPSDSLLGKNIGPYALKNAKPPQNSRSYEVTEMNQLALKREHGLVGRMVVTERYKYILFDGGKNREQLFDLEKDSGELHPVTHDPAYKNELQAHRQMLHEWIKKSNDNFAEKNIPVN